MRISEKEGRELAKLPIGLIVEFVQKKKTKQKRKVPKNAEIGEIHAKARHYRVVGGKIIEIDWKD